MQSYYSQNELVNQILASLPPPVIPPPDVHICPVRHLGIKQSHLYQLENSVDRQELHTCRLKMIKDDVSTEQYEAFEELIKDTYNLDPVDEHANSVNMRGNDSPGRPDSVDDYGDTLAYVGIADLIDEPEEEVSWIVDQLLPTSGLSLLVSKPKVGKSTISRQLAAHVSSSNVDESYWLGRKVEVAGGVLLLALEEKRAQVRTHLLELGITKEHNLNVVFWAPPTADPLSKLYRTIDLIKPSLVIIDPMQRILNLDDGNDYSQTTNALNPFVDLVRTTGVHLMLIHHNRKSNEGDRGDQTLGSTGYFASVDTQITMTRDSSNRRIVSSLNRYGKDLEKVVINEGAVKVASFDEVNSHAIEEQILEILTNAQGRVKQKSVNDDCGKPPGFTEIVYKLVKENKVMRTGKGVRGNPYYLEV